MDDRKRQGDRAHRWKTRAEAAEADICSLTRLVRDIQKYALTPEPVLRSIEQTLLAIAERARESRGATDDFQAGGDS